jgi:hypothetical protein
VLSLLGMHVKIYKHQQKSRTMRSGSVCVPYFEFVFLLTGAYSQNAP